MGHGNTPIRGGGVDYPTFGPLSQLPSETDERLSSRSSHSVHFNEFRATELFLESYFDDFYKFGPFSF